MFCTDANLLWRRYSFAIVGINITDLAYSLLVSGALKTHLYNVAPEMPSLVHFQQTFCECYNVAMVVLVKTTLVGNLLNNDIFM